MNSRILKKTKRFFALGICILLLISILAGCAKDSENNQSIGNDNISENNLNQTQRIYRSEIIPFPPLPDSLNHIDIVLLAENAIYFTAWNNKDEGQDNTYNTTGLFNMDVDGTNLTKLPDYIPGSLPTDLTEAFVSINAMQVDNDGYLWVSEFRGINEPDFPDGLSGHILRKLDKTGAEISVVDLGGIAEKSDLFYVHALNIDIEGNIYIASETNIYILDNNGSLLFNLDNPDYLANFVRLSDGTVAFVMWQMQQDRRIYLQKIDTQSKSWGEIINLPPDVPWIQSVFPGNEEFLYLYNDNLHLNGINAETGELEKVLNWSDSTLSSGDITGVMFLPDGRIAATRQPYVYTAGSLPPTELILLIPTSIDELPEKQQLKLGTFNFESSTRYAVELFNQNSNTHSIDVIDYSLFNTDEDSGAGLLRLSAEIIAGNAPDILDLYNLPLNSYVSKGLLVDLYPFLDADPELSRSSLIESVLKASEIDGSLYRIVPSFFIGTILGNPKVLGSGPGWTFDEFTAVLDANPEADLPLGSMNSKMAFFGLAIRSNMEKYIDPASGTANFDSDDFINLLELANTFPPEQNMDNTVSSHRLIAEGRQIMDMWYFWDFVSYPIYRTMFSGELVFKGFPTENRDGSAFIPFASIAVTTSCKEPDVAWEFVRLFLLEEHQNNIVTYAMPSNRAVFEERLISAMSPPPGTGMMTSDGFILEDLEDIAISQEEADKLRDFVNSITRMSSDDDALWTIVSEGAEDFFNGRGTAQETARIIQNRAAIYLSEQN